MDRADLLALTDWIARNGLTATREGTLLEAFCSRATKAGLPLKRVFLGFDTLHPVLEGSAVEWRAGGTGTRQQDYTREDAASGVALWESSPFHWLMENGRERLRRRLDAGYRAGEFPILDDLKAGGTTDYVAYVCGFGDAAKLGEMDCIYSSWTTGQAGGFDDDQLRALDSLVPQLSLAMKTVAFARSAETLMTTYLGQDAGRRVLSGAIQRGVAEKISAVLWLSHLQGFTRFADSAPGDQIIPFLSDYADALVTAIHGHGGQVLKFMGDGILAFFGGGALDRACAQSIAALEAASASVADLNRSRAERGLPVTGFYLGLHLGEVFYGNIGSVDRLDFTVVGQAVNELNRIEALCRSLEQTVVASAAFREAATGSRDRLVSLGRYALRGVGRPQELFTLDPEGGHPLNDRS